MGLKNKIFVAFLLAVIGVQGFVIYGLLSAEQQPAQPQINPVELKENSAQVYFCPEDNCEEHILETLENAKKSVHFLAYSFTLDEVEQKMIELHNAGFDVKGVFEKEQNNEDYSAYFPMKDAGIDVRIDSNPEAMHNKVIVIDGEIVIGGSMNYSTNGNTRNDENLIIIKSKEIASQYENEFQEIYAEAN